MSKEATPKGLDTDGPARIDPSLTVTPQAAHVRSDDTGPAAVDSALRMLGHTVDSTTPIRLDTRGHVVAAGVTKDVATDVRATGDAAPAELERLRETMTGLDRKRDGIVVEKHVAHHAAHAAGPITGKDVVRGVVLEGYDAIAVDANAHGIRAAIDRSGNPVLVSGSEQIGKDGKPLAGWVTVTAFDAKTHTFTVLDPRRDGPQTWDTAQMNAFAHGETGGNAIQVAARPPHALDQKQIDAVVAATPAEMRETARWTVPLIANECARAGVTDPGQVSYILATAAHESHLGDWMHEGDYLATPAVSYYEAQYRGVNGNRPDVPLDGFTYRGTGFIQVTGRGTFAEKSEQLGFSKTTVNGVAEQAAVVHPELLARPDVAARALVVGMRDGWYGNREHLAHYVEGTTKNFYDARGIVNGDKSHFDDAHPNESIGRRIEDQAKSYDTAIEREPLRHIKGAVESARASDPSLPVAKTVAPWDGKPHAGTMLRVDDTTFAIHVGRGAYQTLDLATDLHGKVPALGAGVSVERNGTVDPPVHAREAVQR